MSNKIRKACNIFLVLCIVICGCCCNDVKAAVFATPISEASTPLFMAGNTISREDVCTVEMLGASHFDIMQEQIMQKHDDSVKISKASAAIQDAGADVRTFRICSVCSWQENRVHPVDLVRILQFIHNKDGKK